MNYNKNIFYSFRQNKLEYSVFTIIFLLSASPFLSEYISLLAIVLVIFSFIYFNKHEKLDNDIVIIFLAITFLNIANMIVFSFISFQTFLGNYVRFLMPYFGLMLIGYKFPYIFVRVIKLFTIISLIFYIPANIIPGFNELLQNIPKQLTTDPIENNHFIIYTVEFAKPFKTNIPFFRNSGPTGEPGEFVGYLVIAMIFELIINRKLWTKNNKLFAFAILTTFSTTGYIAFFILLSAYYVLFGTLKGRLIIFPLTVLLAFNIYFNFEFMYTKINQQINTITAARDIDDVPRNARLPNLVRNLWDSFEKPIWGKGRNFETRYSNWRNMSKRAFSNNATAFPVQFGWPFFIFYTFLLHAGFKKLLLKYNMNKYYANIIVLIIYTLSLSQGFLLFPLFVSFIYLRNIIPSKKLNEAYSNNTNTQSYTISISTN